MREHVLVGKKVLAVYLAVDRLAILFDVSGGDPIIARVDGDCCSATWIENVEGAEALIGRVVTAVNDIEMPDLGNVGTESHPDVDMVAYYGTRITTDNGECVIDYRNDSNGCYGGSLEWPDYGRYYGGVFGQNVTSGEWRILAPIQKEG
jgi:hypothetical protein